VAAVVAFPNSAAPADLLEEIGRREQARLKSLSKAYARSVPIASDIDPDSCLRRQVFNIVAWQDKPLPEAELQARFEAGNLQEREGIAKLLQLGFDVVEQQVPFELFRRGGGREVVLRGKTDGKVRWGAQRVPFEVKSLHPNIYAQVDTLTDFDKWAWARRYPSQLEAYLIGHGAEWGFFLLTDCLGHWKTIRVDLDLELAERIWQFAERAHDGVLAWRKDGTLPDTSKDPAECARCEFFGRTCQPDIVEQGAALLADPELITDLERREALIVAGAKELDRIDESIKKRLKAALAAPPRNEGETLEAYAARLKSLGAARGIAGRFAIAISAKYVKAEQAPRGARVDRSVSIEPLTSEPVPPAFTLPPGVGLLDALRASLEAGKAAKSKGEEKA
jgi:hypothetical protein